MLADIYNVISVIVFFAVGLGLLRIINRFEPQWVSRDGLRFSAKICPDSDVGGKWIEARVVIDGESVLISGRNRKGRQLQGNWTVSYLAESQEDRRRHYVIARLGETKMNALLRVPATSRCVAVLDSLIRH